MTRILIKDIQIGERLPLVFILGPCVIESRDHALQMAEKLKILAEKLGFPLIYKSSFDKANRSDINSYRGPGLDEGLKILAEVKKQFDLPILTDIHEPFQAEIAAKVVDVLQIPAFLCRQTDLILAIARTGKVVNVKKGQFVAPHDIIQIVRKIESVGNHSILLTDRGTSFGYGGLISDVRAVPIMQKTGYPVIYDATHSAQVPGGNVTGGAREFIPHLSRAMVAAGCDGLFMEVHDNVDQARSDRATQYPLDKLPELIKQLMELGGLVR
ncbi:MAG: 3-deoxy-8-phosphooctulonate synthase [Candidatus Marinimicrobia bacterium]|jgi:2-dehydro-3-deoxyphosphooctonate aldolase (KDO 8-P synthase)|nr:3-deoxy-8-phosphooctulonate synthase [Candidatus Neomarinimicrobiota bacterium]MCK9560979.1 3-deoxy-8-phosphooctulonate synthase [Candidatus Neomarinimicrobiota bacterium]